eukprot:15440669-Alexandrium_andersonii.AAC.1
MYPRRAEQLVRYLLQVGSGLAEKSPSVRASSLRSVSFPGYRRDPAEEEEAAEPLDEPSAGDYRALAARACELLKPRSAGSWLFRHGVLSQDVGPHGRL